MCEVTRDNFDKLLPSIESAIKNAVFVAFDCEFSGLYKSKASHPSFLDSPQQRYEKWKEVASSFTICQIGLSAFIYDGKNRYLAETYNFYLHPHHFGPINTNFMFESSATEFLCNHKFDFNKTIYSGIPFLNQHQESLLHACHNKRTLVENCPYIFVRQQDDKFMLHTYKKIEEWLSHSTDSTLELPHPGKGILEYIFLATLERKFLGKFSYSVSAFGDKVVLTKFPKDHVRDINYLEAEYQRILKAECGFSEIIRMLADYKTPIVGHNCVNDLVFLYQKFINPLPNDYHKFKKELHKNFPSVYDTKLIAFKVRQMFEELNFFDENNLEMLYQALSSHKAKFNVLYSPDIRHKDETDKYASEDCPHEAGYDSFITGYVFIKMAHFVGTKEMDSQYLRQLLPEEHIESLASYKNCIAVAKFQHRYVSIDGKDPPAENIIKFYVASKNATNHPLSSEIAKEFAVFGSADVKMISKTEAVVGVACNKRTKKIVKCFEKHKKYHVVRYSALWHSQLVKSFRDDMEVRYLNSIFDAQDLGIRNIGGFLIVGLVVGTVIFYLVDPA